MEENSVVARSHECESDRGQSRDRNRVSRPDLVLLLESYLLA